MSLGTAAVKYKKIKVVKSPLKKLLNECGDGPGGMSGC